MEDMSLNHDIELENMEEMEELELDELEQAAGGKVTVEAGQIYVVKGVSRYLALRSSAKTSTKNIIGKLKNGDKVVIIADFGGVYKFVRPVRGGSAGYVNGKYLRRTK